MIVRRSIGWRLLAAAGLAAIASAAQADPVVDALNDLAGRLSARWNPSCGLPGMSDMVVSVSFRIAPSGEVLGRVEASGDGPETPAFKVASDRARRAVLEAAPFKDLPPDLYNVPIKIHFNARAACAR